MEAVVRGRTLIGTRFVSQGRDPTRGMDCVGLILAAFAIAPGTAADDYRLSGEHRDAIAAGLFERFRRVPRTRIAPGDVLLLRGGARHWHLGIWTGSGLLHADAQRRMTLERPGSPEWPIAAVYRARVRKRRGGSWQR